MTAPVNKVLYASYVSPFPTNSGERIRVLNLIAGLHSLGYGIEAVVGNYDGIDLTSRNMEGIRFHQIPFAWPRLRQATSVYFRAQQKFIRQVLSLHQAQPLKAIILDYGFMGAQIPALARIGVPVVLGTHNLESVLTGQVPKSSFGAALSVQLRQRVEAWHERAFFPLADAIICVSEEDRKSYSSFISQDRLHIVANFIDVSDRYGRAERRNRIIMTGSFDNFQNLEGLRWFVDNVWDGELQAKTELCVAGKHSDRAVLELGTVPGIVGLGAREDLLSEITLSRCAIVPLQHGGGTRFKCLEAMAVRTPVVTTSKGCEGIEHGGTFRVVDHPSSFKSAILELLEDEHKSERVAAEARAVFDRCYSLSANAALLDHVLASAAAVCSQRISGTLRRRFAIP